MNKSLKKICMTTIASSLIFLGGCDADSKKPLNLSFKELVESKFRFSRKEVQVKGCMVYDEDYEFHVLYIDCESIRSAGPMDRIVIPILPSDVLALNVKLHYKVVEVKGVFLLDEVGLMSVLSESISYEANE